ncbi:MAG TPA: primosomal protein N' [Candidatus Limenecus avicola]|uniref:Replication restart protein PriA n=1 Tax=Candidatus Limenecus avicola TaxID=2840847 RepID=A0A9D1SR32_9CLOT|nr:primosomal protein N' [Candidatus Limenecus avicola]
MTPNKNFDTTKEQQEGMFNKYALVLTSVKGIGVKTFSYLIPDEMKTLIKIGQPVLVPFGRMGLINAFVTGFTNYLPEGIRAKKISKILDTTPIFDIDYLKFLEWTADYYFCSIQNVIECAVPMKFLNGAQKELTEKLIEFKTFDNASKRQIEILEKLKEAGKTRLIDFEKSAKTTRATLNKLEALGCVEITQEQVFRNPIEIFKQQNLEPFPPLLDEQKTVYEEIEKRLGSHSSILLHGVTSSGKTEVYFKAIQKVLEQGKNVLFLAPEIALASVLTQRLARRFGTDKTAIWHSSISDGEKFDVWQKIKNNEIRILAGARSAVFAPLKNIGLIIIDEEHESAYKQTMPAPRYDARKVAQKLAELNGCPLLSGSATPDINTYYYAKNSGNLLEMKKRYNDYPMAKVRVVDMREEHHRANHGVFSRSLVSAIEKNLRDKKQTIILMNRRGFSTYTQCLACGEVIQCPKCAIPLIFHSQTQTLKCHYCEHEEPLVTQCPKCGSDALQNCGTGVQKVELIAQKLFPDCNIVRLDSDSLARKNEHIRILEDFRNGKIDILIGTQMLAKGLDNPNVTLVGVINADNGFNLPDFRSCERGFQLLTQVAGRAGRGDNPGEVYFQTYNPDFFGLETAKQQDYKSFYNTEIEAREDFDYPPFSQIIRVILSSKNQFRAERSAQEIAMRLNDIVDKRQLTEPVAVLGPNPCVIERLQEYYRFQILIKNKLGEKGRRFILSFLAQIKLPDDIKLTVDVDPIDIL